jgi:hypothetical protein
MAWRITEQVVRGELDCRVKGRVTGSLWLIDREAPIELALDGYPLRDLAGHVLRFSNPDPKAGDGAGLASRQDGTVGDMTASRKVKALNTNNRAGVEAWHWANALYIEWFSGRNGRVVIAGTDFKLDFDFVGAWQMSEAEEETQTARNREAMLAYMQDLGSHSSLAAASLEDEPTSVAESEADAHDARMRALGERIERRVRKEGRDIDTYSRIMEEERERLRRELGEPEPRPLTPAEAWERARWIEELNASAEEAADEPLPERIEHPTVTACGDLGCKLHRDIRDNGWVSETALAEHPLYDLAACVEMAGVKMAGALIRDEGDTWPPPALFAGDKLVRLKKARSELRDALAALTAADGQGLAEAQWRQETRSELDRLLCAVNAFIRDVRNVLENGQR